MGRRRDEGKRALAQEVVNFSLLGVFRHQLEDRLEGALQNGFLPHVGGCTEGLCDIYFLIPLPTNSSYIFLSHHSS